MSLLRKMANLVVELDEEPQNAAEPPKGAAPATAPISPVPITALPAAGIDNDLRDTLMKKAFARRTVLSGMIESADKLKSIIPDETMRLKAAAATTGTVTAVAIQQALQAHQVDLNSEKSAFARDLEAAKTSQVTTVIANAAALETQANNARSQIEQLTKQVADLTQQAVELRNSAAATEQSLAATQQTFEATVASVEASLAQTADAILSALK